MMSIFYCLQFFIILNLDIAMYLWLTWEIRKIKYVYMSPYIIFPKLVTIKAVFNLCLSLTFRK